MKARSKLRVTGDMPTAAMLRRFPNWEPALDEEGLPDQDETTLRPCVEQLRIGGEASLVAVSVECPSKRLVSGFLFGGYSYLAEGEDEASELHVFDGKRRLVIQLNVFEGLWRPNEDVSDTIEDLDFTRLPMRCVSVTPSGKLSRRLQLLLTPDGELRMGKRAGPVVQVRVRRITPRDVVVRDRSHVPALEIGEQFDISGKRRRRTGGSKTTAKWIDGGKRLSVRTISTSENVDGHMETVDDAVVCDARTGECVASRGVIRGDRWDRAVGRSGVRGMPRGTLPLVDMIVPFLELSVGASFSLPIYSGWLRRTYTKWYVVEKREREPESGRMAWRVADYMGGPMKGLSWFDVKSFRLLARRFFGRAKSASYDRLTVYR